MNELIKEAEYKCFMLPDEYFKDYFFDEFLPKLKSLHYELRCLCNEQADSLPVAEFQDEIKKVIL